MSDDTCIQCKRTADEIRAAIGAHPGAPSPLLARQRPLWRTVSEYLVCHECAVRIREDQDSRAQEAIRVAERSGV